MTITASSTQFAPALYRLGLVLFATTLRAETPSEYEGVYFGNFAPKRGTWALACTPSMGFHFVGFVSERRQLIEGSPYWWDVIQENVPGNPGRPGHFWDWGPYGFEGTIINAYVSGTAALRFTAVGEIGLNGPASYGDIRFSGEMESVGGAPSTFTGSWSWIDDKPAMFIRRAHVFVGPSGRAVMFVHDVEQGGGDCGVGTIDKSGQLFLEFEYGSRLSASIDLATKKLNVAFPLLSGRNSPSAERSGSRLSNVSVRVKKSSGSRVAASITMRGNRPILVRAIGPGLQPFLPDLPLMDDPHVSLYSNAGELLGANENWSEGPPLAAVFRTVGAFPLADGSKDAAVVLAPLERARVYLTSKNSGEGLLEAFVTDEPAHSAIAAFNVKMSISDTLLAGLTVDGAAPKTILIRGLGPALEYAPFNAPNFPTNELAGNPALAVFDVSGREIAANDDWPGRLAASFGEIGASPLENGSKDAAIMFTFPPGTYTVELRAKGSPLAGVLLQLFEVD